MCQDRQTRIFSYFDGEMEGLRSREQALAADERRDEAVFVRVRFNIFEAFHAVFSAGIKICRGDEEQLRQFFLTRTEQIAQSWLASRQKAMAHDDTYKLYLEDIKLEACADIRSAFMRIWEGSL